MFAIVFRVARLVLVLPSKSAFEAAVARLLPFGDESAHTADEYAIATQSIEGQEMSIQAAIEAGILDEEGDPTASATVYRAA